MWLVTGIGRSGTTWFFHFLKENGLEVYHEGINPQTGALGWPFFAPGLRDSHPGTNDAWDVVLHQVRSPVKCIASLSTLQDGTFRQYESVVGKPEGGFSRPLHRAMWNWLKVNEYIEAYADYRFRVEDLETIYPDIARILGITFKGLVKFPRKPVQVNSRPHFDITWEQMSTVDWHLANAIWNKSQSYGYQIKPYLRDTLFAPNSREYT